MKAYLTVSCMLAISTIFSMPVQQEETCLVSDEIAPVFQRYLAKCRKHNMANQPVHLRNASREKSLSSSDITLLNLDLPSLMQINEIAELVLFGDADVVHLRNTSTNTASHLYELLQDNYAHFIHVPSQEKGFFIASKYPLSQAGITRIENDNTFSEDLLEFVIHDGNYRVRVGTNDLSIEVGNPNQNTTMPVLLGDVPGTFTVIKRAKHQFSLSQLAERADLLTGETFEIVPVRRGGRDSDDRGGGYTEGSIDFKSGPDGAEWSASLRGGYEDNRGNYAEVEIKQNDRGETACKGKVGHDNDK